jgi:hypothetical protein
MPEQKLDLLQVSSGEMTEAGTPAAEVMGSEVRDSDSPGRTFHHVPYGFGCEVVPPELAVSAHSAKDETCRYPRNLCPVIYGAFHPLRHRNRSDVRALPDQIGHNPVFLPDLKVVGPQPNQLGAPETASYENCQNCPVPLPPQNIRARRAQSANSRSGFPTASHPSPIVCLPTTRDSRGRNPTPHKQAVERRQAER